MGHWTLNLDVEFFYEKQFTFHRKIPHRDRSTVEFMWLTAVVATVVGLHEAGRTRTRQFGSLMLKMYRRFTKKIFPKNAIRYQKKCASLGKLFSEPYHASHVPFVDYIVGV